jgi:hypothetical protein
LKCALPWLATTENVVGGHVRRLLGNGEREVFNAQIIINVDAVGGRQRVAEDHDFGYVAIHELGEIVACANSQGIAGIGPVGGQDAGSIGIAVKEVTEVCALLR